MYDDDSSKMELLSSDLRYCVHKVYDYSLKVGKRKGELSEPRHKHVAAEDDVDIKHR